MHASPSIKLDAASRGGVGSAPGGGLLQPIPLLAVAVLVVNDHALKAAYATTWTGKLSDFAGLLFFPLLLQGIVEVVQGRTRGWVRPSRALLLSCAAATAVAFAAINLSPAAAEVYRHGLGLLQWPFRAAAAAFAGGTLPVLAPVQHTLDPTDLIALPAVGLSVWLGDRRHRQDPK